MSKVNLTIVGTINPQGKEEFSYYVEKVGELYKKTNTRAVNKFKITKALIGSYKPDFVSIMEFIDMKSFNEVFESEVYKELLPYRDKAFSKLEAYISEEL